MANKVTISPKNQRLLHSKSGNRCAMCKMLLTDPANENAACIGENAHIYGENQMQLGMMQVRMNNMLIVRRI